VEAGAYLGGNDVIDLDPIFLPVAINNAGFVIGYDIDEDIIIYSGFDSNWVALVDEIPPEFLGEVTPTSVITISDTDANGDFQILFNAQYQASAFSTQPSSGTFLLTIPSAGDNTLQQVALPPNVNTGFSSGAVGGNPSILNPQGLIGTLGTITTDGSASAQKALLLIPVQFSVQNSRNVQLAPNPNNNSIVDQACYTFAWTASIPKIAGLAIQIGIVQDIQPDYSVIHTNQQLECTSTNFLPDSPYPNFQSPPMSDPSGNYWVATRSDALTAPFSPDPTILPPVETSINLSQSTIGATMRDFAVVQIGTAPLQVVSQIDIPQTDTITATPSPMEGFPSSSFKQGAQQSDPSSGETKYGSVPTAGPQSPNTRVGNEATNYVNNINNWK